MTEAYCRERLALFDTLLKRRSDIVYGRVWTLEPASLRFKHGETLAELKVPYHMGAEDEAVVENAVAGLAALMAKRFGAEAGTPSSSTSTLTVKTPPLKDKTYLTDIFTAGSLEKRVTTEILPSTSAQDSALLSAWFCPGGHGRAFISWVDEYFEKVLKDEAKGGWTEPTSYLALLAVINTIKKKKDVLKTVRAKGLTYEKLDLAVGVAMCVTLRSALATTLDRLRDSGVSYYRPELPPVLLSALVPKALVAIPQNLLSTSLNPYGINAEIFEVLLPHALDFSEEIEGSESLTASTAREIKSRPELMEKVRRQFDVTRVRRATLEYLMEFDVPGAKARDSLHGLYTEDRVINNFLDDPGAEASEISRSLEEAKSRFSNDPRSVAAINDYQRFLASFKKSVLSGFFRGGRREESGGVESVLQGFYACRFDDHVERFTSLMRGYLADRRGEYSAKMLKEEYGKGRLYRFSTDEREVVKTLRLDSEGQLFVDMKDFTRKTLKVKEIAMADFMKEYFYRPILKAGARYSAGMGVGADEKGITLTNLPGDAAIFSGGVAHLVSLAKDIQRVIMKYRESLERRLPPKKEDEIIEEVHKRFEGKRAELVKKREELNDAVKKGEGGLETKLISLGEEEHRLENTYREELEAAIKGELEAGLYISYGVKAEAMVVDGVDELTGPVKVAIGEKINESARGTYRNSHVRAKLEILLEEERRRNKDLAYPFDVYIDRIYSLRMPPELETPFEKLVTRRNPSGAEAMTKIMANEFLGDLKKIISGETFSCLRLIASTTDIYNKGQALSRDALVAYVRETRGVKLFFRKTVEEEDLAKAVRDAFFIPFSPLEFWFGVQVVDGAEHIEGFLKVGEVIFKGFEGNTPTVIYEMLNQDGDFFRALARHHLKDWVEEARGSGETDEF